MDGVVGVVWPALPSLMHSSVSLQPLTTNLTLPVQKIARNFRAIQLYRFEADASSDEHNEEVHESSHLQVNAFKIEHGRELVASPLYFSCHKYNIIFPHLPFLS